jgi:hypothetical protein
MLNLLRTIYIIYTVVVMLTLIKSIQNKYCGIIRIKIGGNIVYLFYTPV